MGVGIRVGVGSKEEAKGDRGGGGNYALHYPVWFKRNTGLTGLIEVCCS